MEEGAKYNQVRKTRLITLKKNCTRITFTTGPSHDLIKVIKQKILFIMEALSCTQFTI